MSCRIGVLALILALAPSSARGQGSIKLPVSLDKLQEAARTDSNDAAAHYNVALGYWNGHKWSDASRELHLAVKLDPRFAEAYLALARLPYAEHPHLSDDLGGGKAPSEKALRDTLTAADHYYRRAFVINPLVDMRIIAASISSSVSYYDLKAFLGESFALYYQSRLDCFEGKYTDCEAGYSALLRNENGSTAKLPADVYWYHGIAAAHDQHFDDAIRDFQVLIDREQQDVQKVEEKGVLHVPLRAAEYKYFIASFTDAEGKRDDAIPLYKAALESDLGLYMAHVRMADILEAKHDLAGAAAERRDAVNANPDDASLDVDLGITLGRAGQFADARDALRTATAALPRSAEAWFWLGIAEKQLGNKDAAKTDFQKVIDLAPSRMKARADAARQQLASLP